MGKEGLFPTGGYTSSQHPMPLNYDGLRRIQFSRLLDAELYVKQLVYLHRSLLREELHLPLHSNGWEGGVVSC